MERLIRILLIVLTVTAPLSWAYDAYCSCKLLQQAAHSVEEGKCGSCCATDEESSDKSCCHCEDTCDHAIAEEPKPATLLASVTNGIVVRGGVAVVGLMRNLYVNEWVCNCNPSSFNLRSIDSSITSSLKTVVLLI